MSWQTFFANPIIQIVLIVAIAALLHHFSHKIIKAAVERSMKRRRLDNETSLDMKKRRDTVSGLFTALAALVIWIAATALILQALNFDLAQIAAGAGFLGIVIGLGAQATIRDILAGIFILMENQYRVGDIVSLSGGSIDVETTGVIEDITLRITKLRDIDGTLHIVRNGEASVITNRTFNYSSVVVDVGVAYDSDIDLVEKTMNDVGQKMLDEPGLAEVIKEPIHFFRVDHFADSAVIIKTLGKVEPAQQWAIAGEYRRRLLKEFKKKDIEIAFPQLVIHNAKK